MKNRLLFLFVFFTVSFCSFSQNNTRTEDLAQGFDQFILQLDSLHNFGEPDETRTLAEEILNSNTTLTDRQRNILKTRIAVSNTSSSIEYLDIAEVSLIQLKNHFLANKDTLHNEYAFLLSGLGDIANAKSKYKQAEQLYQRGKSIRKEISNGDDINYSYALQDLAVFYLVQANLPEAENLLLQCKDIRQQILGTEHPLYAKCIHDLGVVFYTKGKYEEAKQLLVQSSDIFKSELGERHRLYANSLINLGDYNKQVGDYKLAEFYFQNAIAVYKLEFGDEHPYYADAINSLAGLLQLKGNYIESEKLVKQVLKIRQNAFGESHPQTIVAQHNVAHLQMDLGKYGKAENRLLAALEVTKQHLGKEHPYYSNIIGTLGKLYRTIGNYELAKSFISEALNKNAHIYGKEHPYYANALLNTANLYLIIGEYENVPDILLEAQTIIDTHLGKKNKFYASSENSLGVAYYRLNQFDKAEEKYLNALNIFKNLNSKDSEFHAAILNNLGDIHHKRGNITEAIQLHEESLRMKEAVLGPTHNDVSKSLDKLSFLHYEKGEINKALTYSLNGLKYKQNSIRHSFEFLSELEKTKYQQRIVGEFNLIKSLIFDYQNPVLSNNAYNIALFEKGLRLNASIQTRQFIYSMQDPELQKKYKRLTDQSLALSKEYAKPESDRIDLDTLKTSIIELEKELANASAHFRKEHKLNNMDVYKLRPLLKSDELAIEFTHFKYRKAGALDSVIYAAVVLDPNQPEVLFLPLFVEKNSQISALNNKTTLGKIKRMYSYVDPTTKTTSTPKSLFELIWKPLEQVLIGKKNIYYSSTGLLHRLNLNAIPIDADQVMADRYQMYNMLSTKSIAITEEAEKNQIAFLLGDVNYELSSSDIATVDTTNKEDINKAVGVVDRSLVGDSWDKLPATKSELQELKKSLEQSNFKVIYKSEDQATEESFKALGTTQVSPCVIHLATHGFFFPDPQKDNNAADNLLFKMSENPMLRSGLILAGANHAWEGGKAIPEKEDGILTAYEISHMNLSNTDLVVLSACKTGLGDIQGSEGVHGLQRAFKKAGVKYLVMSLWEVEDEKTSVFMTSFYKNWLVNKKSIRAAFNATQLEMKKKFIDPIDWAGFVLIE